MSTALAHFIQETPLCDTHEHLATESVYTGNGGPDLLQNLFANYVPADLVVAGAGQAAKICNNMILGATMIATCEAFNLAEKLGLDLQTFFDISSKASGQSWSMTCLLYTSPSPRD